MAKLERETLAAFEHVLSDLDEHTRDSLALSFYEEIVEQIEDGQQPGEKEWSDALQDILQGGSLEMDVFDAVSSILLQLEFAGAFHVAQDDASGLGMAVITVGMRCVAVLAEDGDWWPAKVIEVVENHHDTFVVQFDLGGKKQEVLRESLCTMSEVLGGDEEEEDECPICCRVCARNHMCTV